MPVAIFGIENDGLDLAVNLLVLGVVVVWFALIVWTYLDAQRRITDPVLVACATAASFFPYIGTFIYTILRPPDFLEDVRERELEIRAAELRVKQLSELTCPNCEFPVEKSYLRCPNCQRRLKDPCQSCGKPVDPRWALCPYCETALPGRQPQARGRRERPARRARKAPPEARQAAPAREASQQADEDSQGTERPQRPSRQRRAGKQATRTEAEPASEQQS
jgi:hypothetical protein